MHGTASLMYCSNKKSKDNQNLYQAPLSPDTFTSKTNTIDIIPRCKICGAFMRPHMQFFGDPFLEVYHQSHTIVDFMKQADCLVIAGSNLETTSFMPMSFLERDPPVPIIEVNE